MIIYSSLSFITTGYDPKPSLQTKQKPNFFNQQTWHDQSLINLNYPTKKIEEKNNKDKTENTPHITPQTSKTSKKSTGFEERSIKSNTTRDKYIRNPENIPYYNGDTSAQRTFRRDHNQHRLEEVRDTINSIDDELMQPLDEDAQGNVLPYEELKKKGWLMFNELQAKKTASQKRNQKMKIALYTLSNPEKEYVNDTMNRNK
jgi:hypothetical protein